MSVIPTREQVPQIVRGQLGMAHRLAGQPGPQQAEATSGITGREIMRILRKRKWLIIISLVLAIAIDFAGTLLWRTYAPAYTATAFLGVNPLGGDAFATGQTEFTEVRVAGLIASHAQMIGRESVLRRAVESEEVKGTAWFEKDPEEAVERIADILSVAPIRDTNLIILSVTMAAPQEQDRIDLAEIVNAVATAYVAEMVDAASQGRADHIARLRTKRSDLQEQLDTIGAEIRRKKLPEVPLLHERIRVQGKTLEALATESVELSLQKRQAEEAVASVEGKTEEELAEMHVIRELMGAYPRLLMLQEQAFRLESLLNDYLKKFRPKHRLVVSTRSSLAAVRERIALETRAAVVAQAKAFREQNEFQINVITAQLLGVKGRVAEINTTLQDLQRMLRETRNLRAGEGVLGEKIGTMNDTLLQLELLSQADRPVWLRARAARPKEIARPKWVIMMPLGVLVGLALGLGLAFLLELMDTSIKGPADLAKRVDLPMLGMIPHADDLEEDFEQMPLAFMEHPNSPICEAHRQIRTCLLFSGPASQQRSLLVSSPLPGDGRTTLTMNLAHSIAHSGRNILVVDANFHQPAIAGLFPQCPEQGLSNVLVGQGDWRALTLEIEPNLSVLGSGLLPPNPAELLGSEQMRAAVAEMVEAYDQVLFDGAPCLVVADPVALSGLVDGVILVVRAGANTFGVVQRVKDMFLRVGSHLMGVVLNGVRVMPGGYLRKNYEAFYEYREHAQLPSK